MLAHDQLCADHITHSLIRFLFVVGLILAAEGISSAETSILDRSPVKTIYIIQLSHCDIGFTDTQAAVAKVSAETIDRAIELCAEDPEYKWTIESLWQLEQWTAGKKQSEIERLMSLVKSGRMSLSATYAGMLSALMGSEELCRSMYFAERLRSGYGVEIVTAIQNDIPGYSWAYPQVLSKSGVRYFVTGINPLIGAGADVPTKDRPFYWEGPDGSRILSYICSDVPSSGSGYLMALWDYGWGAGGRAEETVPALLERLEKDGYPYDAILVMAGTGDNAGTNLAMTRGAREWNAKHPSPKMVVATPEEFLRHMEGKYAERFPVYRGDWSGLWDQNAQGIPYGTALARRVHDELPAAEALASCADILGLRKYPRPDLDSAWENVITFDEHSGGGGWPGTLTKEQTLEGDITALGYAKSAFTNASRVLRTSLEALSSAVKTSEDGVFVWNPGPHTRSGLVRLRLDEKQFHKTFELLDSATGKAGPYQKVKPTREFIFTADDVAGLGYKTFMLRPLPHPHTPTVPHSVRVGSTYMENEFLRLEVSADGVVTSLRDKLTGRELVDAKSRFGFGQLVQAWSGSMGPTPGEGVALESPSIKTGLAGPLAASLVITDPKSPLARTEIILNAGEPIVRFRHSFDLRRTPYAAHGQGGLIYDIAYPFDLPGAELQFDTAAGLLDPEVDYMPGARSIILVQHGGDISNSEQGISFASRQAFMWEFGRVNWLWGTPIPPDSTCLMMRLLSKHDEAQYKEGIGPRRVEPGSPNVLAYDTAFFIHAGDRDSARSFLSSEANPMPAVPISANPGGSLPASGQFIQVDAPKCDLLAFKKAEVGDGYILRLMETAGTGSTLVAGPALCRIKGARLLDNVEREMGVLPVERGRVQVSLRPREILSLKLTFSTGR